MNTVNCGEWSNELDECARRGARPSKRLSAHLSDCGRCGERWEAARTLNAELRKLRLARSGERSQDVWRRRLMAEFARLERSQSRSWFRWAWASSTRGSSGRPTAKNCLCANRLLRNSAGRDARLGHVRLRYDHPVFKCMQTKDLLGDECGGGG